MQNDPISIDPPMRCASCFYILDNLDSRTCPECGRAFDPADEASFTRKLPFNRWLYWLPLLLTVGIGGGLIWLALILYAGFGIATTVVTPVCLGVFFGYNFRPRRWGQTIGYGVLLLGSLGLAVGVLSGMGVGGGVVGGFCGVILFLVAILPILFGYALGLWLVSILYRSKFSQREYLHRPGNLLILLVPILFAAIEGRHAPGTLVTVTTSQIVDASADRTWDGIQFFEEVHRPTPWLLRLSPSLRPLYTVGHSEKIGDVKTCIYERGKLKKRIVEMVPNRLLAFAVIEQDRIENDSAILQSGRFDLTPIDAGHTRVLLTTTYQPLLRPRFAYAWAESLAVHTLHGHVLAGMKDKAETNRAE